MKKKYMVGVFATLGAGLLILYTNAQQLGDPSLFKSQVESSRIWEQIQRDDISDVTRSMYIDLKKIISNGISIKTRSAHCKELMSYDPHTLTGAYMLFPPELKGKGALIHCEIEGHRLVDSYVVDRYLSDVEVAKIDKHSILLRKVPDRSLASKSNRLPIHQVEEWLTQVRDTVDLSPDQLLSEYTAVRQRKNQNNLPSMEATYLSAYMRKIVNYSSLEDRAESCGDLLEKFNDLESGDYLLVDSKLEETVSKYCLSMQQTLVVTTTNLLF